MKKQTAILVLSACLVAALTAFTPPEKMQETFFRDQSQLAIQEMERSGIPASITLAQAALESFWGESELAKKANNYFGMKCKSDWTGETYSKQDDDRDEQGNKINSCFRVYPDVESSFTDRTDYLMNRPTYEKLFLLASDDYKGWAYGLEKCGYATNPKYAENLIDLIERYNLDIYDKGGIVVSRPAIELNSSPDIRRENQPVVANEENDPEFLDYIMPEADVLPLLETVADEETSDQHKTLTFEDVNRILEQTANEEMLDEIEVQQKDVSSESAEITTDQSTIPSSGNEVYDAMPPADPLPSDADHVETPHQTEFTKEPALAPVYFIRGMVVEKGLKEKK